MMKELKRSRGKSTPRRATEIRTRARKSVITSARSDVAAKRAFVAILCARGFSNVRVTQSPADITATRRGRTFFFELKCTEQTTRYFGAATLTEWEAALRWPKEYVFVVAMKSGRTWKFEEYSPIEFMEFSYIPPFKVFFNLRIGTRDLEKRKENRAIRLTERRTRQLVRFYKSLRKS